MRGVATTKSLWDAKKYRLTRTGIYARICFLEYTVSFLADFHGDYQVSLARIWKVCIFEYVVSVVCLEQGESVVKKVRRSTG